MHAADLHQDRAMASNTFEVRYMHNIEQGTACGHARQGLTAIHGKGIAPSVVSAPANGVSLSPVCSIALGAACKQY